MSQHRTHYTPEFQLEAARLVVEQGYSHPEAAGRLGVCSSTIKNWVKKYRQSGTLPPVSKPVPEALELKALRKENQRLQMEVAILRSYPIRLQIQSCSDAISLLNSVLFSGDHDGERESPGQG